ncbi:MAG TPA: DUF4164 family protein [Alphaproteobacteria bacterium]|nr:DUF4164 family protein [Alphaproteobacteria bacterium]
MARLEAARQRLEKAIVRLELAAQASHARSAERARLAEALEAARSESRALREVGSTVSGRLDAVIGQLKHVLEA